MSPDRQANQDRSLSMELKKLFIFITELCLGII